MGKKKEKQSSSGGNEEAKPPPSKKAKVEDSDKETQETISHKKVLTEHKEEIEKLQLLVMAFNSQQQDQYEIFRRSTFPKTTVRRLIQSTTGSTVSQNVVIAMAGMAKVFVGEIVELGCQARDRVGESGPLQPKHIREAIRILRQKNKIPSKRHNRIVVYR